MAPRQSVRDAAAAGQRGGNGNGGDRARPAELAKIDDDVRGARGYLKAIVPAHISADTYVALVIGALHKDDYLAACAARNPGSLMAALAEGARLGLVPGDGFALVPFQRSVEDDQGRRSKIPVITPVTEYTGELELIYRTGRVESVVCEVVFDGDLYIPGKHPHDPPVFIKGGKLGDGQASPFAARGSRPEHAAGAFGYAVMMSGGISRVVEMSAEEILLHRDAAPSKKVWDGPFWRSQWLKTIIHELFKWVPKSPEFAMELMRATAAASRVPDGVAVGQLERPMLEPGDTGADALAGPPAAMGARPGAGDPDPRTVPGTAEGGGKPGGQRDRRRGRPAGPDGNAPADQERLDAIGALLETIGVDGGDGLRVVAVLGGSQVADGLVPLTNDQAATVAGHLRAVIAKATTDEPAVVLMWQRVAEAEHAAGLATGAGTARTDPDGEGHSADPG